MGCLLQQTLSIWLCWASNLFRRAVIMSHPLKEEFVAVSKTAERVVPGLTDWTAGKLCLSSISSNLLVSCVTIFQKSKGRMHDCVCFVELNSVFKNEILKYEFKDKLTLNCIHLRILHFLTKTSKNLLAWGGRSFWVCSAWPVLLLRLVKRLSRLRILPLLFLLANKKL